MRLSDLKVLASMGHVCDIPSKSGAVDVNNDFKVTWLVNETGDRQLSQIAEALANASQLILATDPDREGEAISWHIVEQLKERCKLEEKTIQRVSFNEITKETVLDAMKHPRTVSIRQEREIDVFGRSTSISSMLI